MAKIVESIFGLSPEQVLQKQKVEDYTKAQNFGMLVAQDSPGYGALAQAFSGLGSNVIRGVQGLTGVQDPELKKAVDMKSVQKDLQSSLSGADMKNPSIYFPTLSKKLSEAGYENEATQALLLGNDEIAKYNKNKADIAKTLRDKTRLSMTAVAKAKQDLKTAQDSLKTDPDNSALKQDVSDYQLALDKLLKVTDAKAPTMAAESLKAKKILADVNSTKEEKESAQDFLNVLQADKDGMAYDAEKNAFVHVKGSETYNKAYSSSVNQLKSELALLPKKEFMTANIDKAMSQVGPLSTGVGSIFSRFPGTPANDLQATVDTIKANIGFDALQEMRDNSPTGGALGQVAVMELQMLQATLGNLSTAQSVDQFKSTLQEIKTRFNRYKAALEGSIEEGYSKHNRAFPDDPIQRSEASTRSSEPIDLNQFFKVKDPE
jgi:hypothetical protein